MSWVSGYIGLLEGGLEGLGASAPKHVALALLLLVLAGSLAQDILHHVTCLAVSRFRRPYKTRRRITIFFRRNWARMLLAIAMVVGAIAYWWPTARKPEQVAVFAGTLQEASLSPQDIEMLERLVLSGNIPLFWQRRFARMLFAQPSVALDLGARDGRDRPLLLRLFRVLDLVSSRMDKAYEQDPSSADLVDVWPIVRLYDSAHHRKCLSRWFRCDQHFVGHRCAPHRDFQ